MVIQEVCICKRKLRARLHLRCFKHFGVIVFYGDKFPIGFKTYFVAKQSQDNRKCKLNLRFGSVLRFKTHIFQICVSDDSRSTAWVSFDGRNRQEIEKGDA